MGQVSSVVEQSVSPGTKVLLGLVAHKSYSAFGEVHSSTVMEDLCDIYQAVELQKSPGHLVREDLVVRGILSPNQLPETLSDLGPLATLDTPSGGSSNQDSIGKCHGSGIHQRYKD